MLVSTIKNIANQAWQKFNHGMISRLWKHLNSSGSCATLTDKSVCPPVRNIHRFTLRLCVFAFSFSLQAQAELPQNLQLNDLLERATDSSLQRYEAQRDLRLAQLDFQIFQADFKPQITGFANLPNYSRSFSEVTQPDGTIAFQPIQNNNSSVSVLATQRLASTGGTVFFQSNLQRFDDFGNDATSYNGLPFRLGISQPLFAFNSWKWERKTAPLQQQVATKKYAFDREQIRVEASRLFFDLLVANQNLEIAKTNLSNNVELVKIAEERFELGKISQNDLLQLKLEGVTARRSQQTAQQAVRLASANIYNYLGISYNEQIIQPEIPAMTTEITVTNEQAQQFATQHRFENDDYLLQILQAERELERTQKDAGLNMDLTASIGYSRSAQDVETIYSNPQREEFLQVSLNVPILNWGRDKARIEQQQIGLDFTRQSIDRQRQQLTTEIQNTVYQMQTVQEQLALAKELQELTQQRFTIARESFVLGAISTTELGIAQQEKDFALRDYILTLRNYWISFYELRRNTLYDFIQQQPLFVN
ncbi:MAG: TolC family protein [Saprospiraceae bacterium]